MNLYCWPHRTVHHFTLSDVEEILYSLTGQLADADQADAVQDPASDPTLICPNEALQLARDSEMYLELVEQGVECRRDLTKPGRVA